MITLETVLDAEGTSNPSEEEHFAALQRMINAGQWSMQGNMGRTMMRAIEAGRCMLGKNPARDYWGNFIPARSQVQEGTKGSRSFVVRRMGEDWARMLDDV